MKKLVIAGGAIALLAAGIVRLDLVAQAPSDSNAENNAAINAERAAKQQAMIDAARRTYMAVQDLHELGAGSPHTVYVWSSYIRSAQVRAADSRQRVIKACQEHLDRMQRLHAKVAALREQGAEGGEADKYHATEFYVAEADLLLSEAKANEHPPLTPKLPSKP